MSNATQERQQGIIKFFNQAKGWGFITSQSGEEVFFHHTAIQPGYTSLNEGDTVEFSIEQSPKGPRATDVVIL